MTATAMRCRCSDQYLAKHGEHRPDCQGPTIPNLDRELQRIKRIIRRHVAWLHKMASIPLEEWDQHRAACLAVEADDLAERIVR